MNYCIFAVCALTCGGLRQCIGIASCCSFYDTNGACISSCSQNATNTSDFTCICPPGSSGRFCSEDIDECTSNPCQNGGNCTNIFPGFSCNCSAGYSGDTCAIDDCDVRNPCRNRGTCSRNDAGDIICLCQAGFRGNTCEGILKAVYV